MRTKILSRFVPTMSRFEIRGLLLGLAAAATISSSAHAAIVVNPGGPYITPSGAPLTLFSTGSYSTLGMPLYFEWNFGDGSSVLSGNSQVNHNFYGEIGASFQITLMASDGAGGSGTALTTVKIGEWGPMPPFFPGPATGGPQPVSPVPEPATWAMMLLGFGGIGFAMRRRKSGVPQLA